MSPLGDDGSRGGAGAAARSAAPVGSAGERMGTPLGPLRCRMMSGIVRHHSTVVGDDPLPFAPHGEGQGDLKQLAAAAPSAAPAGSTDGCMSTPLGPSRRRMMSGDRLTSFDSDWRRLDASGSP